MMAIEIKDKLNEFQIWNLYCKELTSNKREFAETYMYVTGVIFKRNKDFDPKLILKENKALNALLAPIHFSGNDTYSKKTAEKKISKNEKIKQINDKIARHRIEMSEVWARTRDMSRWKELGKQVQDLKEELKEIDKR